jgi:cobalt/nickel transport system permease protein
MLNFPVAGGTSGHFVGGGLAAIMLGPWAAILVMTAVVATQALIFQDGGLVALGVNLFNMAVLTSLLGWAVFRGTEFLGSSGGPLLARGFAVAWVTVVASAAAVAVQLAVSGTAPLALTLTAMVGVHALIGIGEGLITVGALAFIAASRKDLLEMAGAGQPRR